jgi:hypothetical protein
VFAKESLPAVILPRRKEVVEKVHAGIRRKDGRALAIPGWDTHEPDPQEVGGSTLCRTIPMTIVAATLDTAVK